MKSYSLNENNWMSYIFFYGEILFKFQKIFLKCRKKHFKIIFFSFLVFFSIKTKLFKMYFYLINFFEL